MIRLFLLVFLVSSLIPTSLWAEKKTPDKDDLRIKIGPTLNPPIEYEGDLYFLATTGVLYKSNDEIDKLEVLFQTEKSSVSGVFIHDDIAYFGEGIHSDKETNLYAFDLDEKKLLYKHKVVGHIEKEPVFHGGLLYVSMGHGGFGAFDPKSKKFVWKKTKSGKNQYHIDSTPQFFEKSVCVGSVYKFKGVVCFDQKTGEVTFEQRVKYSAKGELGLSENWLYGFATEANMVDSKWKTPSVFYIIDLKKKKLVKEVKLRGFNFYSPSNISLDEVFVSLSTGDLITISLINGKISYVDEFPEPFVSSTFDYKNQHCAIGAMGKLLCYKKTKAGYALSFDKRYFETPFGRIGKPVDDVQYIPSRVGFFSL